MSALASAALATGCLLLTAAAVPATAAAASPPTAVTEKASSITETGATLNATVNPNGTAVSKCTFEYAAAAFFELTHTYELTASCATLPGAGTSADAVTAPISGLSANTTYDFRIVAQNAAVINGEGADETFTTLDPPPSPPTAATEKASSITETGATLSATVNPNGTAVTNCTFEYGTTIGYGKTAPCTTLPGAGTGPEAVSASLAGLSPNTTYHFRIVAENAATTTKGEGADETFKTLAPPPSAPTATTGKASSISETGAMLNATVNPNGTALSECTFEYGTTIAYGKTAACAGTLLGAGTSPEAVSASVGDLSPNTTYHFRIVAQNFATTTKGEGADETFKTLVSPVSPPTAVTGKVSSISETGATLSATVNPNGTAVTNCTFEYGTTIPYEKVVPCAALPGAGTSPEAVSASVSGLSASTTYHFRIVAQNAASLTNGMGVDASFTTAGVPVIVLAGPSAVTSAGSGSQSSATAPAAPAGANLMTFSRPRPPTLRVASKTCRRSDCTVEVLASAGTGLAAVARIEARLTFLQPYPCHEGRRHFTCTRLVSRWLNARATTAPGRFSIVAAHLGRYPYTLMLAAIDGAGLYELEPIRVALAVRRPASTKR